MILSWTSIWGEHPIDNISLVLIKIYYVEKELESQLRRYYFDAEKVLFKRIFSTLAKVSYDSPCKNCKKCVKNSTLVLFIKILV